MTKERLEQLVYLKKEIEQHKRRIAQLEREYLTAQNKGEKADNQNREVSNRVRQQVLILKENMEKNLAGFMEEALVLNKFISQIDDSQMRQILCLRYLDNLTWQQVAFRIGESDESYPRRKHNEFLKRSKYLIS